MPPYPAEATSARALTVAVFTATAAAASSSTPRTIILGSQLPAVLADPSVSVVELAGDIRLMEQDWPRTEDGAARPVVVGRNVTIRPSASARAVPCLLDFNLLSGKVQLLPGVVLTLEDLVLYRFYVGYARVSPSLMLLANSPPPQPGMPRAIVHVLRGALHYFTCLNAAAALAANTLARQVNQRPVELPGTTYPLREIPQPNCTNSSSARMYDRCYSIRGLYLDNGYEGRALDPVGIPKLTNYILWCQNSQALCANTVSATCLNTSNAIACYSLLDEVARQQAVAPQLDVGGDDAGSGAGSPLPGQQHAPDGSPAPSGSSSDAPLEVILPVAIGLPAAAAAIVALFCWWRRRQRQLRGDAYSKGAAPTPTVQLAKGDAADSSHCDGGKQADRPFPVGPAAGLEQPSSASPERSSGCQAGGGHAAATSCMRARQGPGRGNTSRPALLTEAMAPLEHIQLDLKWGEDFQVFQTRLIGNGATSHVLEGSYQGQRVAVKVLHVAATQQAKVAEKSLFSEMAVLSRCSHPNVVQLLGACLTPPHMCLVMELMDQSLEQLMVQHTVVLPLRQVLQISLDAACALAYLHPTVVHRDLKPANILLDAHGNAKLSDFGLARLRTTVCATATPEAGTVPYMAPECFNPKNAVVTHKADIYSWAMLLWEMLAGTQPWQGLNSVAIAYTVTYQGLRPPLRPIPSHRCPHKLRELLEECWDADPQRRCSAAYGVMGMCRTAACCRQAARAGWRG